MDLTLYKSRRQSLGSRFPRTLFVIPSGSPSRRSHAVADRYKAPADYLYLTGSDEPGLLLIALGSSFHILGEGHEERSRLDDILLSHLSDADRIAFPLGRDGALQEKLLSFIAYERRHRQRRSSQPLALCDSRTLVGTIRLIKSPEEILLLREAARRSSRVLEGLMSQPLAGRTEREVSNWIEAGFLNEGMQWTAYETLVGSAERTVELHALASGRTIRAGDWVMIDAGGEWQGYCADITRCMPAGPAFTAEQKALYQAVLNSQKTALKSVRPGRSLLDLHQLAQAVLVEELEKIGWPKVEGHIEIDRLMPHQTSHWLGLDVHDPAPYFDDNGAAITLQPGMCFTVEPGIYCRPELKHPEEFPPFGVRIEDDVLVTQEGHEVLTSVPKEVEEIEQRRAKAGRVV